MGTVRELAHSGCDANESCGADLLHAAERASSGHYGARMLLSLVFTATIVVTGFGLTYCTGVRLRLEERLAIGTVTGVFAVSVVTFLAFELFGMGGPAIALGLGLPFLAAAWFVRSRIVLLCADARSTARRLRLPSAHRSSLRPLVVVTAAAVATTCRLAGRARRSCQGNVWSASSPPGSSWPAARSPRSSSCAPTPARAKRSPLRSPRLCSSKSRTLSQRSRRAPLVVPPPGLLQPS